MRRFVSRSAMALGLLASLASVITLAASAPSAASPRTHVDHTVIIPLADKFVPFHLTIHAGEWVTWVNNDTDDHTVVSDDAFTNAGHRGLNQLIRGTDANDGKPGTFTARFEHPGAFVYYCRFHAHLDSDNQPVAPGPKGGVTDGTNFGTPMSGVITVLAQT